MALEISASTEELLAVLHWPGIGVARARELARSCDGPADIMSRASEMFPSSAKSADDTGGSIRDSVRRLVSRCRELDISVLSMTDAAYPSRLRGLVDAPPILYVKGSVDIISGKSVSVVGTRKASAAGLRAAEIIASHLAKDGVVTVSGLALGIDTVVHASTLQASGRTFAVLAHGLDSVAPSSNRTLAQQIVREGGALVSEHPPGVPARPPEFARRNRIQCGLSICTVVVESGESGGTMAQASFAKQQGRPLFAIRSSEPGFNHEGADRLQREFAAEIISGTSELRRAMARLDPVARP